MLRPKKIFKKYGPLGTDTGTFLAFMLLNVHGPTAVIQYILWPDTFSFWVDGQMNRRMDR